MQTYTKTSTHKESAWHLDLVAPQRNNLKANSISLTPQRCLLASMQSPLFGLLSQILWDSVMLFFPGANVEVFQYYMKGCIGRLTCLPLIYCLLSWNGRIVGVRTTITQHGVFLEIKSNIKAPLSCINMQQVKSIIFWNYYEGLTMRRCVKLSHFKTMLISSGDSAYNNDDYSLLLSCWALTWDARADSGSTLVLTSKEFLFDVSTWVLQSMDLK